MIIYLLKEYCETGEEDIICAFTTKENAEIYRNDYVGAVRSSLKGKAHQDYIDNIDDKYVVEELEVYE